MKKDKQDLKETVDELIDDRNSIKTALSDLTKEVHQLRYAILFYLCILHLFDLDKTQAIKY